MIRTGNDYRASLRDGREVWMNGERVDDVTTHPAFRPIVDVRARIYDMAHEEAHRGRLTYEQDGEAFAVGLKLPREIKRLRAASGMHPAHELWEASMDRLTTFLTAVPAPVQARRPRWLLRGSLVRERPHPSMH
jgi:aromatic ring hydroxylase